MGCGKYSTEFFFSVAVLGDWRLLGCHVYLQDKAPLLRYRPYHLLGTCSQAHLVDEFKLNFYLNNGFKSSQGFAHETFAF